MPPAAPPEVASAEAAQGDEGPGDVVTAVDEPVPREQVKKGEGGKKSKGKKAPTDRTGQGQAAAKGGAKKKGPPPAPSARAGAGGATKKKPVPKA